MGLGDNLMLKLDETVTGVLGEWDIYTSTIAAALIGIFAYQIVTARDPDTHPMLLARQAQASPVRQEGESPIFRSQSAPHGMPLNSGLNVKDPGDSKWARGRDGDLRDIWRKAVTGVVDQEGKPTGEIGEISTVLGTENVIVHNLADITRQINLIGQHIKQNEGKSVAIYLPNSIEFLATLFACAFYDLTAILVPYDQPVEGLIPLLLKSKADTVVAAVGSFPFDVITKSYPALKQLIWVVDEGSKHMDWNEVPTGTGGAVNVATWQDIIQDQEPSAGTELPPVDKSANLKNVLAFGPNQELVEYTQANLIAGVAGQITSIPNAQRIKPSDLFLPADSLTAVYSLTLTLAALYSNASVALNSVAGRSPDLVYATQGIAPTVIVASSAILAKTHEETSAKLKASSFYPIVHWFQTRSLVEEGVMPLASTFSRIYDSLRPIIGTTPGKLRLVFVSKQVGADSKQLKAETLSDLRIFLGARIIYALTAPKVAGALTQTGLYDYRVDKNDEFSHFGVPVTSIEIVLKDSEGHRTTDTGFAGEVVAKGPAVVGGEQALGVFGKIKGDHTLVLL